MPFKVKATYAPAIVGTAAPTQSNGPPKPTVNGKEAPVTSLSLPTASRLMSTVGMFGPLSGTLTGTNHQSTCVVDDVLAGELLNKTQIFVAGVTDMCDFLAWLRATCSSAQLA